MIKKTGRFLAAAVLAAVTATAGDYRLGEGLQLGQAPIYLGGYFSLDYWNDLKGTSEVALDDVSVMLYGNKAAWNFMAEVELSDAYRRRFGFNAETVSDLTPHAERVYARYESSEYWRVTLGKFNTPVGYWNLMPINVLRDTTSSPKVVSRIFPRYTTGADLCMSGDGFSVNLLAQVTPDLDTAFNPDDPYNNLDIENQYGAGVTFDSDLLSYGFNAGGYKERVEDENWGYLYASAEYRTAATHIMAETGYRQNASNSRSTYGAYIQGTQTIAQRHFAVVRLEYITEYIEKSEDSIAVVGYTYRPLFPIALKGEYQFHSRENEDVFIMSFSMLF